MAETPTFDRMAPFYERLVDLWSFGCIPRAKQAQLRHIEPGASVLYAGVGPGSDALAAAERGARVTAVDLSSKMLEAAAERFRRAGEEATFVHGDILEYRPPAPFDVVVANFLIDCFPADARPALLTALVGCLRSGGIVLVADTGLPRGSAVGRGFWHVYQGIAYATTTLQGLTSWLPKLDLRRLVEDAGGRVIEHGLLRPWRHGPVLFEHLAAVV